MYHSSKASTTQVKYYNNAVLKFILIDTNLIKNIIELS